MGIVKDREFDFELKEFKVRVHFYEFTDKWDEWFRESDGLSRIAPAGTYAEEPRDKVVLMPMMHRKRLAVAEADKEVNLQYQIFGSPFYISIGSWYTWEQAYVEIVTQASRYLKPVINLSAHILSGQARGR